MVTGEPGREGMGYRFTLDTPMGMHWLTAMHPGMTRTIPWDKTDDRTHFARVTLNRVLPYRTAAGPKYHMDVHVTAHPGGCPGCSGHPRDTMAYAIALARFRARARQGL